MVVAASKVGLGSSFFFLAAARAASLEGLPVEEPPSSPPLG